MRGTPMSMNRRDWIVGSLGLAASAAIAAAQQHAHLAVLSPDSTSFEFFDPATARDVEAVAAQIIPSDDGPGATEAGAVYFADRALKTFAAEYAASFTDALADFNARRKKIFPGSSSFASLAREQQIQLLKSSEKTPFFDMMREITILAWLGPPEYGGNRNQVGWKYIGFDDAGFFEPPFGYYDKEAK